MPAPSNNYIELSPEQELRRFVTLQQAAELRACSVDTIKRKFAKQIVEISPRRRGLRLEDVLA